MSDDDATDGAGESLLPPNASALERALDRASARLGAVPVQIRQLYDVEACAPHLLPWLAWGLGVDYWRAAWPVEVKRAVIRATIPTRRHRGTPRALRTALEALGVRIDFSEWFETSGRPYTVTVDGFVNEWLDRPPAWGLDELFQDLTETLRRVAPVRVHFDIRLGAGYAGDAVLGAALGRPVAAASLAGASLESSELVTGGPGLAGGLTRPAVLAEAAGAVPVVDITGEAAPAWRHGAAMRRPVVCAVATAGVPVAPIDAFSSVPWREGGILGRPVVVAIAAMRV
ncbi:phage tail protein I [Tistrella mobilis]